MSAGNPPSVLVPHGPNLNLLGTREPEHYGRATSLANRSAAERQGERFGARIETFQSNSESALVERVQRAAPDGVEFIVINPAAFTHTGVALRDALAAAQIPFVEVHLSNVFARESFRYHSYFGDLAVGVISGLGAQGYELAVEFTLGQIQGGSAWICESSKS